MNTTSLRYIITKDMFIESLRHMPFMKKMRLILFGVMLLLCLTAAVVSFILMDRPPLPFYQSAGIFMFLLLAYGTGFIAFIGVILLLDYIINRKIIGVISYRKHIKKYGEDYAVEYEEGSHSLTVGPNKKQFHFDDLKIIATRDNYLFYSGRVFFPVTKTKINDPEFSNQVKHIIQKIKDHGSTNIEYKR